MNAQKMQYPHSLTVVLFAKGRGSDASSYRPNLDESQWWSRRDALVRCTAAFLFGPSPPPQPSSSPSSSPPMVDDSNKNTKTLVILFDEDWSRMQMTYSTASRPPSVDDAVACSEQNVVALWKQAALAACQRPSHGRATSDSTVVSIGGLSCQLILPPLDPSLSTSTSSRTCLSSLRLPSGMDSKRDILEHLQNTCSMDFLRSHGFNSSTDVILRKHNKKSILEAWQKWTRLVQRQQQQKKQESDGGSNNSKNIENKNAPILKAILREILWHQQHPPRQYHGQRSDACTSSQQPPPLLVVAGTLHESHHAELPCWDTEDDNVSSSSSTSLDHQQPMHVCLFLGAVRDMYPYEYVCLQQVVQQQQQQQRQQPQQQHVSSSSSTAIRTAPVVRIRLGPVAEFTSKILTVLAFHHATGRLGRAVQTLVHSATVATSNLDDNNYPSNRTLAAAATGRSKRPRTTDSDDTDENDKSSLVTPPCPSRRRCCLEVICLLPTLESRDVTTDLNLRSRALWCLVRCTVTSLWRSRLASSSSATMATTTGSLITTTLTLVFCDGTILRLRQDEIVKALAEQHQAAPCEYQILAAIEKQLKEQQQHRHTNQKVSGKSTATATTPFWKESASEILATIQSDRVDSDGKSNGSFHVLDLTSPRPTATIPNNKLGGRAIGADEEITAMDLTQHIYSTNAVQANTDLKNSGKDVEFMATIALISIGDNDGFNSASASTTGNGHQQQHENNNMIAKRMRNGFVQACSHFQIPVYESRAFLTTIPTWAASTTISSSISLPPASARGASEYKNDFFYACQDRQAAAITLLQHFLYQNRRLVPDYCQEASPARTCLANSEKDNDVNNGDKRRRFLTTTTTSTADHDGDKSSLLKAKSRWKNDRKKNKRK